jgi:xanthine dehydrogenase accessory factor
MDNIDLFRKALSALEEGKPVALVTVIATAGSTPGKVGYKMLVFGREESIVGTVGGGLLEAKMIEAALAMLPRPETQVFHFGLGEAPDDPNGICGGSIEFLIEIFDCTSLPFFREITSIQSHDHYGAIFSIISPGEVPRKIYLAALEQIEALRSVGETSLGAEIADAARGMLAEGSRGMRVAAGELDLFAEPLAKPHRVILFGAGHVASHIARFARSVHFSVVVCDDRPEYANSDRFPNADQIVVEDFARAFDQIRFDGHSYIVIVTRGHQHDQIVLQQAVRTNARYIGMIGSKRKTQTLLQNLRDQGIPKERLDCVYAPIGISIGAVSAEEIALSIVSELVKIKRLGDEAEIGHLSLSRKELND